MSDVRLSNGSPTLERTDSRVSDHPKPSACRSLFGSVDHDELKREFEVRMREMEQAAAAKWSFDFATHTPLGDDSTGLQWELVDRRDVPDFYSRHRRAEKGVCPGITSVDLNGNHSCVIGEQQQQRADEDGSELCTGTRKRPACLDASAPRKRSHSGSEEELTPRKSSPSRQT